MNRKEKSGFFTRRTKTWEFLNLWFMPIPFLSFGALSFFPLLFMGIVGRKAKLIAAGTITAVVTFFCFRLSVVGEGADPIPMFVYGIVNLLAVIYSFLSCKEFLQRLDLRYRIPNLKWNKKYDYANYDIEIMSDDPQLMLPVRQFTKNLEKMEKAIESESLKEDIRRMIHVSEAIMQKDTVVAELFFERNAETVDKILKKYDELENTRIQTPEIKQSIIETEKVISRVADAFEQELSDIYRNDVVDLNAESAAFLQSLKNRGLLEDEKTISEKPENK